MSVSSASSGTTAADTPVNRMISTEHGDHIVFRSQLHSPRRERRGRARHRMVEGSRFVGIVNSYIGGLTLHCGDGAKLHPTQPRSEAPSSDAPSEPSRSITFSRVRGENILFGGGPSENSPSRSWDATTGGLGGSS